MDDAFKHITVLLHEAVDALNLTPHSIVVDCTFGRGGHSRQILQRLSEAGRLIALDRDPDAMHAATAGPGAIKDARFESVHQDLDETLLVADAYDRVVQNALRLAASIAEEDELQVIFGNIERLHVVRPVNQFRALEHIAAAVVENGGYPLLV